MRERGKEVANPFPFIGVVAKILFGYGGLNILGMGQNFWGGVAKKKLGDGNYFTQDARRQVTKVKFFTP